MTPQVKQNKSTSVVTAHNILHCRMPLIEMCVYVSLRREARTSKKVIIFMQRTASSKNSNLQVQNILPNVKRM